MPAKKPPTSQKRSRRGKRPSTELDAIEVRGAREHNLKSIDVTLPKKKLVVITGVSGSGKSSLAFDTIFAEGQRRYVESLSAYARQFIGQMEKPKYDTIRGLSPTIAIEQKTASKNPRSAVGTITEVYDYLRVLFARIGVQFCISCGQRVGHGNTQEMVDRLIVRKAKSFRKRLADSVETTLKLGQGRLIVAHGAPEAVAKNPASYTGQYLQEVLPK